MHEATLQQDSSLLSFPVGLSRDNMDTTEATSREEHLQYLFEVFQKLLLSELRVSHLLCFLAPKIKRVKEIAHKIHKLEDDGREEEANMLFLKAVKESDEPGRYTAVFEALRDAGCELIIEALMDEGPNDLWHAEHKEILNIFNQNLVESLPLDIVLPFLKELFFDADYDVVQSQMTAGKMCRAIHLTLLYMHRKKSDWYSIFMKALWDNNYHNLAKRIDPDHCAKHFKENVEAEDETGKSLKGQNSGQPVKEPTRGLGRAGKMRASDRTEGKNSGISKIVLNSPKPQVSVSHSRKRSSVKDQLSDKQSDEANSLTINLGSGAEMKISAGKHLHASQPLTSLNTVDDNYPDAEVGPGGSVGSSCECRCCARILTEVQHLRAEVQSLKSELSEVHHLKSEIADIKDLLWKFMAENK